jgi:hypothetical protein
MAWYQKHLGRRWVQLYEVRESEKDQLKNPFEILRFVQGH